MVEFKSSSCKLTIFNEPAYTEGSADNLRRYDKVYNFSKEFRPSSLHGVNVDADGHSYSCIVLAGGGASGVHAHSAAINGSECYIAVGDMVCCLTLPGLELKWATQADSATCFGVYFSSKHQCLLIHGELGISRLTLSGEIKWSAGGADIFTEGFSIYDDQVEAIDFDHRKYCFNIETGREEEANKLE